MFVNAELCFCNVRIVALLGKSSGHVVILLIDWCTRTINPVIPHVILMLLENFPNFDSRFSFFRIAANIDRIGYILGL